MALPLSNSAGVPEHEHLNRHSRRLRGSAWVSLDSLGVFGLCAEMVSRAGLESERPIDKSQVIDSANEQNRSNRHFSRTEVHGGYTCHFKGEYFCVSLCSGLNWLPFVGDYRTFLASDWIGIELL
jgi:hypothetical protein